MVSTCTILFALCLLRPVSLERNSERLCTFPPPPSNRATLARTNREPFCLTQTSTLHPCILHRQPSRLGFPGGWSNTELRSQVEHNNLAGVKLRPGQGDDPDTLGTNTVYVHMSKRICTHFHTIIPCVRALQAYRANTRSDTCIDTRTHTRVRALTCTFPGYCTTSRSSHFRMESCGKV